MKKYTIIFITILFTSLANNIIAQQLYGKWVIPTNTKTYELTFSETGISLDNSLIFPLTSPVEFSGGGYNENYDRKFYVLGETFCYGTTSFDWVSTNNPELQPEYQIIPKPGIPDEYYSFYTHFYGGVDFHLMYNEIIFEGGELLPLIDNEILAGAEDDGYYAYAITTDENSPRYLYTSSPRVTPNTQPYLFAGIRKWIITSTGVSFDEMIISEEDLLFDRWDFDAYNLELYEKPTGEVIIAYIHGTDDIDNDQIVTELIVVNNGDGEKFNLEHGRLAGIEFSAWEPNMIYVSCEGENGNGGIVKVNYTNGQIVETVFSGDFERTFLQTAPDGHIYGVSNSGNLLGRIYQYDVVADNKVAGDFISDAVEFPPTYQVSSTKQFGSNIYYILPENSNVFNQIATDVLAEDVSCPGYADGEVTIYVSGGIPFETGDPYIINCDPDVSFFWDENIGAFTATGLYEAIYDYEITDNAQPTPNVFYGQFIIDVEYEDYTYLEHVRIGEDTPTSFNDGVFSFAKGFTVPEDITATFNNSTVLMGPLASIYVHSGTVEDLGNGIAGVNGGEMILNGTTITNHTNCNEEWQGIEVHGITNASQLQYTNGLVYQGKLVVENNSAIKNAVKAVTNHQPGSSNSHGGIILLKNSEFVNNSTSIEFMPYENFNSVVPDIKLPYRCEFINCTFDINDSYLFSSDMEDHVNLYDVYGINFRGCTFSNNNSSSQNTGIGINSQDAGYKVVDYTFAANIQRSEFYNLYKGINASNTISNNIIIVDSANFINNSIGVYISSVNNAVIIESDFEVGYNHIDFPSCGYSMGFGIDIHTSVGFAFEENNFSKFIGAQQGFYTGIRVNDCPSDVDVIYKNYYDGLSYGNYAYGTNRKEYNDDRYGVVYECNDNANNTVDFIVTHEDDLLAMIHTHQGINNELASGNTFSEIVFPEIQWHFRNEGRQDINWYYCEDENNCPNEEPTKIFELIQGQYFTKIPVPENLCLSHYGNGGGIKLNGSERQQVETDYANNLSDYGNVKTLFDNLKDGGNTTAELLDIQTATPDDMWVLRTQLLGDSPHLSQEVLMETADKTDVFPESAIFDIMAANPDEIRNEEMINYLENKEEPLPDYMISILRQLSNGSTYKTVLLNDMATYHVAKTKATQDIIRSILSDSIVDHTDYRNWLDNLGTLEADKQIISSYLTKNDTTNALALLNMLPGLYELQDEALDAYDDYSYMVNLYITMQSQNRDIYKLDSVEMTDLLWMADSATIIAKEQARNILEFAYDYYYCNCQYISDTTVMKSSGTFNQDMGKDMGLNITAKPNPASDWVQFNYQLPYNAVEGEIIISDITGKFVNRLTVTGAIGMKLWDIRNIQNGVYLYTLSAVGFSSSGKIVISR